MKRGSSVGRESRCGNAQPRHLCSADYCTFPYVRQRQDCTQQVVSRPTARLEQICARWEISPRRRPQAASLCFSTAGPRRLAREHALDLCSMSAATDDAETIRAAAGQAEGSRRPRQPADQKVTYGWSLERRAGGHQPGCQCVFSPGTGAAEPLRLMTLHHPMWA